MKAKLTIIAFICLAFTLGFLASQCHAEEMNWDGTPKTVVKKDRPLNKTSDFLIVSGLVVLATVYDVEATMHAGSRGAKEGNSWARSYVEKGRAETYAYSGGIALLTMGISYAIFKSKNPDTQKYWIVLPAIAISSHFVGGTLNILW